MKWGVYLTSAQPPSQTQREVIANTLAYAEAAEAMGFEDAWVLEHHFTRYGLVGSPLTLAAYILGRTKRLRVGTAINVIPLEHPVRLAEEVALLDQLSDGRLSFGIGRGAFVKDFKVFGVDMSKSRDILSEWTQIMLEAWSRGRVASRGSFVAFDEVEVFPEPYTRPHPPVYCVAQSPSTVEWAAKQGFPMILNYTLEDEAKTAQIELYAEVAREHGHDPAKIEHVLSCLAGVGESRAALQEDSRLTLSWWLEEFVRASQIFAPETKANVGGYEWHHRQWEDWTIRGYTTTESRLERYCRLNPIGSPAECVETLQRSIDATGVRHVVCGFESLGDRPRVLESMARFWKEVIPHIRPARQGKART